MATTSGRENGVKPSSRKRASPSDDTKLAFPKKPRIGTRTDPTRWRMKDDESRHTWHYLEDDEAAKEWPQGFAEKYYMNLPLVCPDV